MRQMIYARSTPEAAPIITPIIESTCLITGKSDNFLIKPFKSLKSIINTINNISPTNIAITKLVMVVTRLPVNSAFVAASEKSIPFSNHSFISWEKEVS